MLPNPGEGLAAVLSVGSGVLAETRRFASGNNTAPVERDAPGAPWSGSKAARPEAGAVLEPRNGGSNPHVGAGPGRPNNGTTVVEGRSRSPLGQELQEVVVPVDVGSPGPAPAARVVAATGDLPPLAGTVQRQ